MCSFYQYTTLVCSFLNVPESQTVGQNEATAFLDHVVNLCRHSKNDWYRVYLIRKICSQHGVEYVQKLLKEDTVRWLFPEELLLKVQSFILKFLH